MGDDLDITVTMPVYQWTVILTLLPPDEIRITLTTLRKTFTAGLVSKWLPVENAIMTRYNVYTIFGDGMEAPLTSTLHL